MKQITTFILLILALACAGQENASPDTIKNTQPLLFDLGDDVLFGGKQSMLPLHIVGQLRSIPADPGNSRAVSFPCYAEVTIDTVPAVELSWEHKGLIINPSGVRDTIGTRVEEVIRIFFYTEDGKKKYLELTQRNYVSGTMDRDRRFETYNNY